jgi:transposase
VTDIVCGVDISKDRLDACIWPGGARASFGRDGEGIGGLVAFCRAAGAELAVMEATGGLERLPFLLACDQGLGCAIVNPGRVRDYARSMGALEKTDRLDAEMIARFALAAGIGPMPRPGAAQLRIEALVTRLRQVTADITVNRQRRASAADGETQESLDEVLALLGRQARRLEGEIASLIDDDPLWRRLDAAFRSVKAVGARTVARLMAELPEIGLVSNKAIAKLAGLAPLADDSGNRRGRRAIRGGRAGVRSILFLISHVARKHDPVLRDFHQRLITRGKPPMVARIAVARRLLVRLNAKARDARAEMAHAT